jgi:hypothetical protein
VATDELIKMTAVPSGVDTSSETFFMSVVLSPELSGGGGTLAGTDFENWPVTLETYQNDNGGYGPAYWDVVLSDTGGTVLFEYFLFLQTSTTSSTLWGSLFPSTTAYEAPQPAAQTASGNDRFRTIPIISYPATQIMDFVTGQYQHYSPTQLPDFATVSAVYEPVTAGLIGVVGQAHAAAQAAERTGQAVPAANDFTDASTSEAYAAFQAYQTAGSGKPAATGVDPIDFHAALAFLSQHGVLQRALGLVFDLAIPYGGSAAAQQLFSGGGSEVFLSASLYSPPAGSGPTAPGHPARAVVLAGTERFPFTQVSARTHCDASATGFSAHSITASHAESLLDASDTAKVKPYPMSIVGDVNATSELPYKLRTIQRAQAAKSDYSSGDFEDLTKVYVPPPTLRSAGLTIVQVNTGFRVADQLARSYASSDAAAAAIDRGDASQLLDFASEDLVRGFILDVYDLENGVWRSTSERNITYKSGSTTVGGPTSAPFDEAAVQAPPRIVNAPDEQFEQLALSEILLSYTGWSNAVARPGTALADDDSALSAGTAPFDLTITDTVPPGRLPPLRFGHTYRLRVRIVDLANNKASLSDPANDRNYTEETMYGRLEPIATPDIYPQSLPRLGESLKTLVIRDVDQTTPSLRALYPQRISAQFAEAHGMFDNSSGEPDPSAYATIVPRESGQYPDPPMDATTPPPTIALDEPVPFLPDPLVRGGALAFSIEGEDVAQVNIDFSPQNGAGWPNYRPFGLEVVSGEAFATSVDESRRVLTVTLAPADQIDLALTATCHTGDVPLLGMPGLFTGTPDVDAIAAGRYWSVTPATTLKLVHPVQTPLATPELVGYVHVDRQSAGNTTVALVGQLAWSPKSSAEVDIVAAWSEPVDDPAHGLLQGPGAPNPTLLQTSGSPVATVSEGHTQLAQGVTSELQPFDDNDPAATDPLAVYHQLFDTKHRVVTYSAVAPSRFAEYYPDGTPTAASSTKPVTLNVLSSAQPEPPSIIDVIPIYAWDLDAGKKTLVSERGPSALRVLIARPWWSSGIGELLGVVTSAEDQGHAFTIDPTSGMSDWAVDPVFASGVLPSRHPRSSSFPSAVRSEAIFDEGGNPAGVDVAGHTVAFDAARDCWYCDIKVDTGKAYTPMIRLALARWQPDSMTGFALSRTVTTQIMSLEPGRTLTIVRGSEDVLSSVRLTGYSYTAVTGYSYAKRAGVAGSGPGIAQVQVERRDTAIHDETLGWELVGPPIRMSASRPSTGGASWTARGVKLPGTGKHRLVVTQYEEIPGGDGRGAPAQATDVTFSRPTPGPQYRLVHQDIVEV